MGASREQFANHYRGLADEELLSLAQQKQELLDTAAAALDAEMAARGLGEDALREFAEQMHAEIEPEAEVPLDKGPDSTELPPDWFDDDTDPAAVNLVSARPKGVTVVSYLFWYGGVVGLAFGVLQISDWKESSSLPFLINGAFAVLLGFLALTAGYGLWRLESWARRLAVALCWVNIVLDTVNVARFASIRVRGFAVDPMYVLPSFGQFLVSLVLALYLGSDKTRLAFRTRCPQDRYKTRT